jgi:hypothetical protein
MRVPAGMPIRAESNRAAKAAVLIPAVRSASAASRTAAALEGPPGADGGRVGECCRLPNAPAHASTPAPSISAMSWSSDQAERPRRSRQAATFAYTPRPFFER